MKNIETDKASANAEQAEQPHTPGIPRRSLLKSSGLVLGASLLSRTGSTHAQTPDLPPLDGRTPPDYNPSSEYVFSIVATIADPMSVGETAQGQIRAIPITGGEVTGERINGRVVPGGADWQLSRPDDVTELQATYAIQLDDGTFIKVVNRGLIAPGEEERYFRTQVHFDAPKGAHAWLNEAIFLCRAGLHPERENAVLVEVYKLV
jgi:hypothetical protein